MSCNTPNIFFLEFSGYCIDSPDPAGGFRHSKTQKRSPPEMLLKNSNRFLLQWPFQDSHCPPVDFPDRLLRIPSPKDFLDASKCFRNLIIFNKIGAYLSEYTHRHCFCTLLSDNKNIRDDSSSPVTIRKSVKKGNRMIDSAANVSSSISEDPHEKLTQLLTFLRSRLNVISTSLYLLETSLDPADNAAKKYLIKINQEIDSIRKYINE